MYQHFQGFLHPLSLRAAPVGPLGQIWAGSCRDAIRRLTLTLGPREAHTRWPQKAREPSRGPTTKPGSEASGQGQAGPGPNGHWGTEKLGLMDGSIHLLVDESTLPS